MGQKKSLKVHQEAMEEVIESIHELQKSDSPKNFCRFYERIRKQINELIHKDQINKSAIRKMREVQCLMSELLALYIFFRHNFDKYSWIEFETPELADQQDHIYSVFATMEVKKRRSKAKKQKNGKQVHLQVIFPKDEKELLLQEKIMETFRFFKFEETPETSVKILKSCLEFVKQGLKEVEEKSTRSKNKHNSLIIGATTGAYRYFEKDHRAEENKKTWSKFISDCKQVIKKNASYKKDFDKIFIVTPEDFQAESI